jgi:hypothetical protein
MNTKKKIFLCIAVLAIAAGLYGYKEYNRKNKDLATVSADIKISSGKLISTFVKNEVDANKKLLDKVVQVDGVIREIIKDEKGYYTIVLGQDGDMSSVRCSMDTTHQESVAAVQKGNNIEVKGICTGFNADELLGSDVILNRSVITNKK